MSEENVSEAVAAETGAGTHLATSASARGDATTTLEALKTEVVAFADARAWGAFHTPGELVKALSVEAGELLQLFLWVTGEAGGREAPSRERVEEEVADVAMCLLNLCHRSGLDLSEAVRKKLIKTGEKYPVTRAHGRAGKYDEL
ncbi:MAG: nucleotide pyrophosphohydrolase [Myxococcota bacterium]